MTSPATSRITLSASIVILDDEPANALLLERMLRRTGYTNVQTTTDAVTALRWCEDSQPDLLILDLQMPGISGFDVMKHLAQASPLVPNILVMTGDLSPDVEQRALTAGARACLAKPFEYAALRLVVDRLTTVRESAQK